jgi:hypothetical protein
LKVSLLTWSGKLISVGTISERKQQKRQRQMTLPFLSSGQISISSFRYFLSLATLIMDIPSKTIKEGSGAEKEVKAP